MNRIVSNNSKKVLPKTKSDDNNNVCHKIHGTLQIFGAIKTQDHDIVKLCKKTSPNNVQNKVLQTLNDYGELC